MALLFGSLINEMGADRRFLASPEQNALLGGRGAVFASPRRGEAKASVTRVFFPHEVRIRNNADGLDFSHCVTSLGDVSFNQIAYGADVDVLVEDLGRTHFVLVIALTGEASVTFGGERSDLLRGDCILMSPHLKYRFQMEASHSHLAIGVPCRRLLGCGLPLKRVHNLGDPRGRSARGGTGEMIGMIEYFCGEFHRGSSLFGLPTVVAAHEVAFLSMMRAALFEEDDATRQATVLPGFLRRADGYIAAHLTEDIGLDDIVAAPGVPMPTLHHGFQQFLGHSPMRWLKLRRLTAVRADILASAGDLSVTELANKYWIGHVGRFATQYREIYGQAPSEALSMQRRISGY